MNIWLPATLYHILPWFYLVSAALIFFGLENDIVRYAIATLLVMHSGYIIIMRFVYGNSTHNP